MALIPIPRLPLVPDPLRRIKVPKDLAPVTSVGAETEPETGGMTHDGVERVWSSVERLYRSGVHPAIALCVRREGEVVIDRAIGHSHGVGPGAREGEEPVLATPETPFVIFSAAKAITAVVVHLLDQQGRLHLGDRICEYIPEYAKHGKDAITIAHVLGHRAGVPNLPGEVLSLENIGDEGLLLDVLCEAKPASRPGKGLAYHAISGGFILAEVVKRVSGQGIREALAAEVLEPLGFRWMNYGVDAADVEAVATSHSTGAPALPPVSSLLTRALGKPPDEIVRISNDPRFLTGVIPAANVVTTANELSRFFELLRRGGELDGVRILEPRTIRRALAEQSYHQVDFTLGFPTRYSLGFMLGAQVLSIFGPSTEHAFGHLGYTNIIGWADPERALSAALLTSGKPILYPELPDLWSVMRRIGIEAAELDSHDLAFDPVE